MNRPPPRNLDDLVERVLQRSGPIRATGLRGAARALVAARLIEAGAPAPALVLAPDAKSADALLEDLRCFLGEPPPEEGGRVRSFPRPDTLPYDRHSPQPFLVAQRMDALYRLLAEPAGLVLVAPITALAVRVPARDAVRARTLHLEVGQTIDRDALLEQLTAAGYARMPLVEERGELAVRGGIVDLFPPHLSRPVRVELLGDDVESIREFDAASQRSQERLEHVAAPPPRELLIDRGLLIARGDEIRRHAEAAGAAAREIDELLDALLRGHLPPGAESLAPWIQTAQETVFDWLPKDALLLIAEPEACRDRLARFADEAAQGPAAGGAAGGAAAGPGRRGEGARAAPAGVARATRRRGRERLDPVCAALRRARGAASRSDPCARERRSAAAAGDRARALAAGSLARGVDGPRALRRRTHPSAARRIRARAAARARSSTRRALGSRRARRGPCRRPVRGLRVADRSLRVADRGGAVRGSRTPAPPRVDP
jgi:transcription-repair coupling factor (superfamily II helicase)